MNTHPAPDLTPENLEMSETCEMSEIYSGYLRCNNAIEAYEEY